MKNIKIGVIAGRHEMPVDKYIFSGELSSEEITNPKGLEIIAKKNFEAIMSELLVSREECEINNSEYGTDSYSTYKLYPVDVELYVSGLTVAVIAAAKAVKAIINGNVVLMHYDRESDSYFNQIF